MIKSAAIKINDKIYTGHRHYSIILIALNDNPETSYISQEMQGFVTNNKE